MGMICVGDKKIADTTPDLTAYALQEDVDNEFENVVYKTDISKNITSDSTDAQVASAKAVFTGLANKPEIDDDDEGESELTVWSAKKVHDELENATKIDDTSTTATDATWSAKKINDNLDNIAEVKRLNVDDANLCIPTKNKVTTWRVYGSNTPTYATYFVTAYYTSENQHRITQTAYSTSATASGSPTMYMRYGASADNGVTWVWGDWQELATTSTLNDYSYLGSRATRIPQNDDLNNYITPGIYTCSSVAIAKTLSNIPTGVDSSFRLEVIINTRDDETKLYGSQELRTNSNKNFIRTIRGSGGWTDWQELATMDKVVPQIKIENKTTDDARTIIKNSWSTLPTNNSMVRIETSIFTWSAQIYKHDDSWGTIILTCYADNKDSYIGKLSNQVWHWYKMGLTEV